MSVLRPLASALLALPGLALADGPLLVTEVGIFCPYDRNGAIVAPDTITGTVDLIDDQPVDVHQTIVPARLTLAFGARYRLMDGEPEQQATIIITHPPMGPSGITRQSWQMTLQPGGNGLSTYRFDQRDEMVIGIWTLQIEIEGQRALYQEFNIVPAAVAPTAIDVCFGGLTS